MIAWLKLCAGRIKKISTNKSSPFLSSMLKRIFLILLCSFLLSGCRTVYNPATEKNELILISDSYETSIGKNVSDEIQKKEKVSHNWQEEARVQSAGKKIAQICDRNNLEYHFYVLDDKELNAFSLPGGFIYINSGLLEKVNDDELSFVLGHEIGHVAAKHAVKKIQSTMAFQLLLTAALTAAGGSNSVGAIAQASDQVYSLISLGYSREDEYFADKLGVKYSSKSGFNPRAAITALEKIKAGENQAGGGGPAYLRTHPYPDDRIKALEKIVSQLPSNPRTSP